jgi:hypothetical protein
VWRGQRFAHLVGGAVELAELVGVEVLRVPGRGESRRCFQLPRATTPAENTPTDPAQMEAVMGRWIEWAGASATA